MAPTAPSSPAAPTRGHARGRQDELQTETREHWPVARSGPDSVRKWLGSPPRPPGPPSPPLLRSSRTCQGCGLGEGRGRAAGAALVWVLAGPAQLGLYLSHCSVRKPQGAER